MEENREYEKKQNQILWEEQFSKKFTDNVLKDGYGNDLITDQAEPIMKFIKKQIASAVEARESSYREEVLSKLRSATCYADPSRGVLLSSPPQHQCEACGKRWVVGEKSPVCDYIRKADITNLNPSKE